MHCQKQQLTDSLSLPGCCQAVTAKLVCDAQLLFARTCRPTLCYRDRLSLRLPVLPRMLLYPHSFAGLPLLYQVAGSAIPRAVVPALMSMALTLIIEACYITRTN